LKPKWRTATIGDIASVQTGPFGSQLHNRDYVPDGTPIVTVEHLGQRKMTSQNLPFVSDSDKERLSKYTLEYGDLVFSRVGSVDRCSWVSEDENGWMFSGRCLRVRANNPDEIYHKFLYYFFNLESTKDFVRNIAVGATMPSINTRLLSEVLITFPSIEEQHQIGDALSALDDRIEENTKINNHLEQMAQAVWAEQFGGLESNGSLGDIIELFDFKRIPLSGNQREKMEKIYPYYGAATLMDYVDNYLFDGIYLLLGEDGTVIDNLGFPTLQYVWGKFWVNNHAHILQGRNGFTVESLYTLLKQTSVTSIVTGAVQPKINQANLKALAVAVPSVEEMQKFNDLIAPLFDQIRKNSDENLRLAELRDALLPKLMSGELSVANLGD
jgi:type I restriction enzyme S subunit